MLMNIKMLDWIRKKNGDDEMKWREGVMESRRQRGAGDGGVWRRPHNLRQVHEGSYGFQSF